MLTNIVFYWAIRIGIFALLVAVKRVLTQCNNQVKPQYVPERLLEVYPWRDFSYPKISKSSIYFEYLAKLVQQTGTFSHARSSSVSQL